ncbi:MAG TPA: proprotein convertase P-domain-containing protein [Fimbriimonadaceae bacterium]|nr:proprotein convertase P-domain-containing protein [Fimbriimonadaceae bacterium]
MVNLRRAAVLAGILVSSLALADPWAFGVTGGAQVDNGTVSFDRTLAGTNLVIDSVDSVVLAQLTHTWLGDLDITLTHVDTGTSVHLFQYIQGDGDTINGDSTDVGDAPQAGNLTFLTTATTSVEDAAALLGNAATIADGNYRPTQQTDGTSVTNAPNSVNTSYAGFVGESLDGTWRLTITDKAAGDTGALGHWELHGTGTPVPEPASLAALGLGALALFRRRRTV